MGEATKGSASAINKSTAHNKEAAQLRVRFSYITSIVLITGGLCDLHFPLQGDIKVSTLLELSAELLLLSNVCAIITRHPDYSTRNYSTICIIIKIWLKT